MNSLDYGGVISTRGSTVAEGPRDAACYLKFLLTYAQDYNCEKKIKFYRALQ